MRLLPGSIRGRMLAASAAATLLILLLAAWLIGGVLERFVTEGLDRRLDAEIALLASTVGRDGRVDLALLRQRGAALEDAPGWRWSIVGRHAALGDADLAPARAEPLPAGPPAPPRPDEDRIHPRGDVPGEHHEHARQLVMATTDGPVTITAAAPAEVVRRPIRAAETPLLIGMAVLGALLTAASILQLRVGLRPLGRLRLQLAAIRRGAATAVDEDQPAELRPLAAELNALADDNRRALAAARLAAANLAHALKTPVAALALELRTDPARAADVARIDATIRHHLARARLEAVNRRVAAPLAPALADLIAAVRRLHGDKELAIPLTLDDALSVAVDPHDLDELLGNLLDNAARYARNEVAVSARRDAADPRLVRIEVADDGPGVAPAERAAITRPGIRLDERSDGHGFGLAIAVEFARLYGGELVLDAAPGGGLLAHVTLPAA